MTIERERELYGTQRCPCLWPSGSILLLNAQALPTYTADAPNHRTINQISANANTTSFFCFHVLPCKSSGCVACSSLGRGTWHEGLSQLLIKKRDNALSCAVKPQPRCFKVLKENGFYLGIRFCVETIFVQGYPRNRKGNCKVVGTNTHAGAWRLESQILWHTKRVSRGEGAALLTQRPHKS